jgi:hypothetical protein
LEKLDNPLGVEINSSSAKRVRHTELLADTDRRGILDFAMTRDGAGALRGRVVVNAVLCTFAEKHATISFEMADQVSPLHVTPLKL